MPGTHVEEQAALATRYGVRGIPDVRAFVNGELVDGFTGVLPQSALEAFVERVLALTRRTAASARPHPSR